MIDLNIGIGVVTSLFFSLKCAGNFTSGVSLTFVQASSDPELLSVCDGNWDISLVLGLSNTCRSARNCARNASNFSSFQ